MTIFEQTIKAYLDAKADDDPMFTAKLSNPKKSIEECCRYICEEVKKTGRQGFCDEEIYGMALHYYDEANIEVADKVDCQVVVNKEIQLTEEEKAKIAEQARKKVEEEELREQMRKIRIEKEKEAKRKAEAAKKAEEKRRQEEKDGMLLFDFGG